jgi:hypothetical protein
MRLLQSAFWGAVIGAVLGVILCALYGAVSFESAARHHPNADLQPGSAWAMGAIWIGIGFGGYAGAAGSVVGLLVGLVVGVSRSSGSDVHRSDPADPAAAGR